MPFKSKAQRRKFYALKAQGKMDQKTIDEWESETPKGPGGIPERLSKKAALELLAERTKGSEKIAAWKKIKSGEAKPKRKKSKKEKEQENKKNLNPRTIKSLMKKLKFAVEVGEEYGRRKVH